MVVPMHIDKEAYNPKDLAFPVKKKLSDCILLGHFTRESGEGQGDEMTIEHWDHTAAKAVRVTRHSGRLQQSME
jgi:hypothetical protein